MRERDGKRRIEIDRYFRPYPKSEFPEYRRNAIGELTEEQARQLYDELGEQLAAWEWQEFG